jgi:uncharacterized protein with HEPN domain
MPKKSDIIRLRHMFDASIKAAAFVRGRDRSSLDEDEKLAPALVRLIEIIGEAAAKVSPETNDRFCIISSQTFDSLSSFSTIPSL